MRGLHAEDVLQLWERERNDLPARRSLSLLECASGTGERSQLGRLSVGACDARLLRLRALTFGDRIEARTQCPRCGEKLEFRLSCAALATVDGAATQAGEPWQWLEWQGWSICFRWPCLADMIELDMRQPPEAVSADLLARCIAEVRFESVAADLAQLPAEAVNEVTERMRTLDPGAEIDLGLACPACRHEWTSAFDIAAYLWQELGTHARRLLREVDLLARIYGWREADILAMSTRRRQAYVDLAGT